MTTQYSYDVLYVKDKSVTSRIAGMLRSRPYDAILLSHPTAVGILYTCIEVGTGEASVITTREVARRFKVVQATSETFDEEIPRTLLLAHTADKLSYIEAHKVVT